MRRTPRAEMGDLQQVMYYCAAVAAAAAGGLDWLQDCIDWLHR
jgi:hypothetical protein